MKSTDILMPSVQSLLLRFQFNGTELATGTGFLVEGPRGKILITARHNVTGENNFTNELLSQKNAAIPNEVIISHNSTDGIGAWIDRKENLLKPSGEPIWYEHPTLRAKADFVAILLTQFDKVAFYPYTLGNETNMVIKPTDMLSVVGFPFGLTSGGKSGIWATGFVATEPYFDYEGLPVFLIDSRTREGQSGSPVIVHRNPGTAYYTAQNDVYHVSEPIITELFGIYTGRINKESDLGFVWKVSSIKELVDSVK